MLNRAGVRTILYGVHALDAPASLDDFKYHMGYVQKPVKECVALHPYVSPFVNRTTHSVVCKLARMMPTNRYLSKAEGLIRSYREQAV